MATERELSQVKAAISAIRCQKVRLKRWQEDFCWLTPVLHERLAAYKEAKNEARAQGWRGGALEAIRVREDDTEEAKDYVETRKLPPIPTTEMRKIGWISTKPEFKLEKYVNWRLKTQMKAPELWEKPGFDCDKYKKL